LEKRKVTVSVGGQSCSFYSDDSDEYIAELEKRANEAMNQTATFSRFSAYTNAVLTVLSLTDQLLRAEQTDQQGQTNKPPRAEQKAARKNNPKTAAKDEAQVSVWDLLDEAAQAGARRADQG